LNLLAGFLTYGSLALLLLGRYRDEELRKMVDIPATASAADPSAAANPEFS